MRSTENDRGSGGGGCGRGCLFFFFFFSVVEEAAAADAAAVAFAAAAAVAASPFDARSRRLPVRTRERNLLPLPPPLLPRSLFRDLAAASDDPFFSPPSPSSHLRQHLGHHLVRVQQGEQLLGKVPGNDVVQGLHELPDCACEPAGLRGRLKGRPALRRERLEDSRAGGALEGKEDGQLGGGKGKVRGGRERK